MDWLKIHLHGEYHSGATCTSQNTRNFKGGGQKKTQIAMYFFCSWFRVRNENIFPVHEFGSCFCVHRGRCRPMYWYALVRYLLNQEARWFYTGLPVQCYLWFSLYEHPMLKYYTGKIEALPDFIAPLKVNRVHNDKK